MKRKDSALRIVLLISPLLFSLWTGKVERGEPGSHPDLSFDLFPYLPYSFFLFPAFFSFLLFTSAVLYE